MTRPVFNRAAPVSRIIEDGLGSSIPIIYIGGMTPLEYQDHYEIRSTFLDKTGVSLFSFDLHIAASLLRHRGCPDMTPEQLMEEAPTHQIVHALADFAKNEFDGWPPKGCVMEFTGIDAKNEARRYCDEHPGMVATTRPDLEILNKWFVYRNIDSVPEGFEIEGKPKAKEAPLPPPLSKASDNTLTTSTGSANGNSPGAVNSAPTTSDTAPSTS